VKAMQIMKHHVPSVDVSESIIDALETMDDYGLDELPVVEDDRFVGVIKASAIHKASEFLGTFEDIPDRPVGDLIGYATTCAPKEDGYKVLDHMEQDNSNHSYVIAADGRLLGEIDFEELVGILPSDIQAYATKYKSKGKLKFRPDA